MLDLTGRCRLVLEAGTCQHDVGWALRAAAAAAQTGAWGFKVQLLTADTITSRAARPYSHGLKEPASQHEAFSGALPYTAWRIVKDLCDDLGIEWFASCWDEAAVDACMDLGVRWFKVGSGDLTHETLLRHVGSTGVPVILSMGAAEPWEIERAFGWIGHDLVLPMVCTLAYPCPPDQAHLARVDEWVRHGHQAGYSDHTVGLEAPLIASMIGAVMVEKHFTITPGAGGDHDFGIRPDQAEWLVDRLDSLWGTGPPESVFMGDSVQRRLLVERRAAEGARRSWHTVNAQEAGRAFGDLVALRPGGGLEPTVENREALRYTSALRGYEAGEMIDQTELVFD